MAEDIKREQVDALGKKQGLSPNLVDAVRDVLAGKKPEVTADAPEAPDDQVEEGKKLSSKEKMKRGLYNELDPVDQKAVKKKFKNRKDKDLDNDGDVDASDKYLHKRRKAISKNVDEGKFKDMVTKDQENKRLGKTKMIANPRNQKTRMVTPSRAKMAVKKGFVYAEHIDGLEEADAMKGQPTGVSVTMKHKDTGKKQTTKFPGTHSAVAGAKSHIAQMQKKGYAVHSKNLMYGKNEEAVNELSTTTLSNYMRKSAASVSGKDAKTQDKRIKGQSMADKKIRKGSGYSSDAKVAASEGTEYHVKVTGGNYAPGGAETRRVKAKSPEHAINKLKKGHSNPDGKFSASPVNEARRGRPAKTPAAGTQDTETRHNIVHQLRKSVSLRGNHKVEFKDGKSHKVTQQHAAQALNKYNSLRTTGEKARYQKDLHHSHDSFHTARQSKTPGAAPKKPGVSLGGSDKLKKLLGK